MEMGQVQQTTNWITGLIWPVLVFGGLGVFIDFALGAEGQRRLKDRMTDLWVRFEDTKWSTFSATEAEFFVDISDRLFGKNLLSMRRLKSCMTIMVAIYALAFFHMLAFESIWPYERDDPADVMQSFLTLVVDVVLDGISFALSLSLTRIISVAAVSISKRTKLGIIVFSVLVLIHIVLVIFWLPAVSICESLIKNWIYFHSVGVNGYSIFLQNMEIFIQNIAHISYWSIEWPVWGSGSSIGKLLFFGAQGGGEYLGLFANFARLLVSISIFIAVAFGRCLRPAASLLWRRIIEDQKGAFTLIFGGIGALASAIKEIVSHF